MTNYRETWENGVLVSRVEVEQPESSPATPLETLLSALAVAETLEEVRQAAAAAAEVIPSQEV